jgi:hypothetical protein
MVPMDTKEILKHCQQALESHSWGNFTEGDERTIGQGGKGVVVVGCMKCKVRLNTIPQFMQHLSEDVLPDLVDFVIERTAISES